ncbi:unnamed protein product [Prorocentrum cordatum]|uniref:Uncharacterized protein n=1 Tax=Prorocentrum cordatum TaxID=2364126 RepID=A0ABN9VQL2_9DINO|nr:unnamed protein product [Polarella glacialis]
MRPRCGSGLDEDLTLQEVLSGCCAALSGPSSPVDFPGPARRARLLNASGRPEAWDSLEPSGQGSPTLELPRLSQARAASPQGGGPPQRLNWSAPSPSSSAPSATSRVAPSLWWPSASGVVADQDLTSWPPASGADQESILEMIRAEASISSLKAQLERQEAQAQCQHAALRLAPGAGRFEPTVPLGAPGPAQEHRLGDAAATIAALRGQLEVQGVHAEPSVAELREQLLHGQAQHQRSITVEDHRALVGRLLGCHSAEVELLGRRLAEAYTAVGTLELRLEQQEAESAELRGSLGRQEARAAAAAAAPRHGAERQPWEQRGLYSAELAELELRLAGAAAASGRQAPVRSPLARSPRHSSPRTSLARSPRYRVPRGSIAVDVREHPAAVPPCLAASWLGSSPPWSTAELPLSGARAVGWGPDASTQGLLHDSFGG